MTPSSRERHLLTVTRAARTARSIAHEVGLARARGRARAGNAPRISYGSTDEAAGGQAAHRERLWFVDLSEPLLVAPHVVLERAKKPLRVPRRRDDAGAHPRARRGRLDIGEVEHELVVVVVDEDEVRVRPLRGRVVDVDLDLGRRDGPRIGRRSASGSFRVVGHRYGIHAWA